MQWSGADRDGHCQASYTTTAINHSDYLLIIPSMALEVTLGTANLLQLVEALSLNAERVKSDWISSGFRSKF